MRQAPTSKSGHSRRHPARPTTLSGQRERARLIQLIHIGKGKLGLDDATYRALLTAHGQADSCTQMSLTGLQAVLKHMEGSGFKPAARAAFPGRPNNCDSKPMLLKIEALLADRKLPWKYASAISLRMFGKERLEFCSDAELHAVIAALVKAAEAAG